MQNSPSQGSSGHIAPAVIGKQKETNDVFIISGLILSLAGLIAAAWIYGSRDPVRSASSGKVENATVSQMLTKTGVLTQAEASPASSAPVTAAAPLPNMIHTDLYFEVGRKGLTDEAKVELTVQADMLKQHEDYGVLITGYTDQQGSSGYNKALGLKRAEAVQAELLNAGVASHRTKAVSLGEDGVLCIDTSDPCRHMNRRVHLEIRKVGKEHMIAAGAATAIDPSDPQSETLLETENEHPITDSLPATSTDSPEKPADPMPGN